MNNQFRAGQYRTGQLHAEQYRTVGYRTTRHRSVWFASFRLVLSLVVFATLLMVATDVFACPTCKDGIAESDPASQAQAAGYFYSILFMMAMPFVLLGTLGGAAYVSIRRARETQADAALASSALEVPS